MINVFICNERFYYRTAPVPDVSNVTFITFKMVLNRLFLSTSQKMFADWNKRDMVVILVDEESI